MRKKLTFKNQNKLFFLFLLAFCFLLNPIDTKALQSTVESQGIAKKSVKNLQYNNIAIIAASERYAVGYTEELMKLGFEIMGGNYLYNLEGSFNDILENAINRGMEYGKEIITYPHCMIFNEKTSNNANSSNSFAYTTGWLYSYCDSAKFEEWKRNRLTIGFDNIPKVYSTEGDESAILIIPAYYFYGTVSSMPMVTREFTGNNYNTSSIISSNGRGIVYAQLYNSESTISAQEAIDYAYYNREDYHIPTDFSGLYGSETSGTGSYADSESFDIGLDLYGNEFINSEDAWIMNFLVAANVENGHIGTGSEYESWNTYPMKWKTVKECINKYSYLSNYIDLEYLNAISDSANCRAFKTETNSLGLDKMYGGSGMCLPNGEWGTLMNVNEIITSIYSKLEEASWDDSLSDSENKLQSGAITINENNFEELYQGWSGNIPANFVKTPVGLGMVRYLWSANATKCMDATTQLFANDTRGTYNVSDYGVDFYGDFSSHGVLSKYPTYGNDTYYSLSDSDKIISVLTCIQDNPSLGARLIAETSDISGISSGVSVESIRALNELGKNDFFKWRRTVIEMGNILFNGCAVSVCASTGWSVAIGMKHNDDRHYSTLGVGISISKEIKTITNDLVVSNSYNSHSSNTDFEGYDPSGRRVIDWFHSGNASLNGLFSFDSSTVGGLSSVDDKQIDNSSTWKQYDINSKIVDGGSPVFQLTKDSSNVMEIDTSNESIAKQYEENPESIVYETIVFVGRTPESNPNLKVSTDQFKLVCTPIYNNFNVENFDPSNDLDRSARTSIHNASKEGSAAGSLQNCFNMFQTSYNTPVLFNVYKSGQPYDYRSSTFLNIIGTVCGIQRMDTDALENYEFEDYVDDGSETKGYSALNPKTSTFEVFSGGEISPGDVVAYAVNYRIPSDGTIRTELAKNSATNSVSSMSILNNGEWYDNYGTILMVDLNFNLVPSAEHTEEWSKINSNPNNDYNRMRIKPPIIKNIFFTKAEVLLDGAIIDSYSPSIQNYDGMQYTTGKDSEKETTFTVSSGSFMDSEGNINKNSLSLNLNWRFFTKGISTSDISENTYNYLDYINSFNKDGSSDYNAKDTTKVLGAIVSSNSEFVDLKTATNNDAKISVNLKDADLNASKQNSISASVPTNSSNQYTKDWEIVNLVIKVPNKNNTAIDLVLAKGDEVLGDPSVYRGGNDNATPQLLESAPNNAKLYGIIKRTESDNKNIFENATGNIAEFVYVLNDEFEDRKALSTPVTKPVNGYSGKVLSQFKTEGDILIFAIDIPSQIEKLQATIHYRNKDYLNYDYEDSAIIDNIWYESWRVENIPDFSIKINDSKETVNKVENYFARADVTVSQENPYCKDSYSPKFCIEWYQQTEGSGTTIYPEKILSCDSSINYLGNGIFKANFTGGLQEFDVSVEFPERKLEELYPQFKKECNPNDEIAVANLQTIKAQINEGRSYSIPQEKNFSNNTDAHQFNELLSLPKCTPTPTEVCKTPNELGCETLYGIGERYEWNVKFKWFQLGNNPTDIVNVKNHIPVCYCQSWDEITYNEVPSIDEEGNPIIEIEETHIPHEVITYDCCHCYCESSHNGANNDVERWRTELGLGFYYEYMDIKIFVWSSGNGKREIQNNGHTYVYTGENFNFWFETYYVSNRELLPDAPYEPANTPSYSNNGSSNGCNLCNILSIINGADRVYDVEGPSEAIIKISGSSNYTGTYYYLGDNKAKPIASSGKVNKTYKFTPVSGKVDSNEGYLTAGTIHVSDSNVNQKIILKITTKEFKGHYQDSFLDGGTDVTQNAYAWEQRGKVCFCDETQGIIYIRPSRFILSTDLPLGIDGGSFSDSDSDIVSTGASISDGDIGSGSGEVDWDEDTWIH